MRSPTRVIVALFLVIVTSPLLPSGAASAQQPYGDDKLIAAAREIMQASRYAALVTLSESGAPRARTMDPFPPDSQFPLAQASELAQDLNARIKTLDRN